MTEQGHDAAGSGDAGRPAGGAGGARPDGAGDAARAVVPLLLSRPPRLGRVRVVCVDGPAGSGKTTLAAALVRAAGESGASAAVVHMDDLYAGWTGLDGDVWPRLSAQVLEPLRRGRPGRFQRYDWTAGRFADWVDVPLADVLVLEGCGSGRRAAARDAAVVVWVEADAATRLARGLARDGEAALPHWERWMRDEAAHFAREGTRGRADVRVDAWGRMAR